MDHILKIGKQLIKSKSHSHSGGAGYSDYNYYDHAPQYYSPPPSYPNHPNYPSYPNPPNNYTSYPPTNAAPQTSNAGPMSLLTSKAPVTENGLKID